MSGNPIQPTDQEQMQKLVADVEDLKARMVAFESIPLVERTAPKQKTLRELVKGMKFKNGQEQAAAVIGFHEMVLGAPVRKQDLETYWNAAKMVNKFNMEFVRRGMDDLFRIAEDDTCVLTQSGETFFNTLMADDSAR